MAGQLKIGGNVIATHAGTEGAGTVTLDSSTLTIGSNTTVQGQVQHSALPAGTIVQVVSSIHAQDQNHSSTAFTTVKSDLQVQITPRFASSNIIIHVSGHGYGNATAQYIYVDLYKNASDVTETYNLSGVTAGLQQRAQHGTWGPIIITYLDTCSENSTSEKTYAVTWRAHASGGLVYFGWGGNAKASMFAYEVTT